MSIDNRVLEERMAVLLPYNPENAEIAGCDDGMGGVAITDFYKMDPTFRYVSPSGMALAQSLSTSRGFTHHGGAHLGEGRPLKRARLTGGIDPVLAEKLRGVQSSFQAGQASMAAAKASAESARALSSAARRAASASRIGHITGASTSGAPKVTNLSMPPSDLKWGPGAKSSMSSYALPAAAGIAGAAALGTGAYYLYKHLSKKKEGKGRKRGGAYNSVSWRPPKIPSALQQLNPQMASAAVQGPTALTGAVESLKKAHNVKVNGMAAAGLAGLAALGTGAYFLHKHLTKKKEGGRKRGCGGLNLKSGARPQPPPGMPPQAYIGRYGVDAFFNKRNRPLHTEHPGRSMIHNMELEAALRNQNLRRMGALGLGAAGVGALGYGLHRALRRPQKKKGGSRQSPLLSSFAPDRFRKGVPQYKQRSRYVNIPAFAPQQGSFLPPTLAGKAALAFAGATAAGLGYATYRDWRKRQREEEEDDGRYD